MDDFGLGPSEETPALKTQHQRRTYRSQFSDIKYAKTKKKSCGVLEIFEASTGDSSPLSCGGHAWPHEGTHKFVFAITLHCTGQEVECQVDAQTCFLR
jgi:hypothetical protein